MNEVNPKVFKGVWIPEEIWTLDALTWMEKCLWAEISFLGTTEKPCFASNAYLAKVFKSSESSISNMISRLKYYKMIKYVGSDGRFRKMVAVVPEEKPVKIQRKPSRMSEGSLHAGVNPDITHECNRVTKGEQSKELTPIVPFHRLQEGIEETSAEASGSSRNCSEISSQNKSREKKQRVTKLADQAFLDNLRANNPRVDFDTELRKMDNWLLAHQGRQRTKPFVTNWINRVVDKLPPEEEWRPTTI